MKNNIGIGLIFVTLTLLVGCQKQSPLGSLNQDSLSSQYNSTFWANEQSKNTPLWKQATQLCNDVNYQVKPNCSIVNQLVGFANMGKVGSHYRDKGFGPNDVPRP